MRFIRCLVFLVLFFACSGCVFTEVGRQQSRLRESAYGAGDRHVLASRAFSIAANKRAAQAFDYDKQLIGGSFERWLDLHTRGDGRLVSMDDGKEVPLLRSQLSTEVMKRDGAILGAYRTHDGWVDLFARYTDSLNKLATLNSMLAESEVQYRETKAELQDTLRSTAEVIFGVAVLGLGL